MKEKVTHQPPLSTSLYTISHYIASACNIVHTQNPVNILRRSGAQIIDSIIVLSQCNKLLDIGL